jgi:hypothetical protein
MLAEVVVRVLRARVEGHARDADARCERVQLAEPTVRCEMARRRAARFRRVVHAKGIDVDQLSGAILSSATGVVYFGFQRFGRKFGGTNPASLR